MAKTKGTADADVTEILDSKEEDVLSVRRWICEVLSAKAQDMLKGADRVNDPNTMRAMAELYTAIK